MQEVYDEAEKIKADVTVLIVEDEDMQRESIARQLKGDQNFADFKIVEVMEAANSQSAEAAINSAAPNLVLLDCHLKNSELQGEELCEKLRSDGFSRPIIMLTAVNIKPEDEGSSLRKGGERLPPEAVQHGRSHGADKQAAGSLRKVRRRRVQDRGVPFQAGQELA